MPDLDLSEEDFKTHWMFNPVEQESTDGNGHTIKHTDKRVCQDYKDYSILRDRGWESVSDIYDSHTNVPSEDPSFTTTPSDLDDLTLVTDDTSDEESDVDTNE
jgi:hypothetical protein